MNSNHRSLARKEPVSVGKANCGFETGFQSRGTDGSNPSPSSGESDANLTSDVRRMVGSAILAAVACTHEKL